MGPASLYRWLNGETREQTIANLTELLKCCMQVDLNPHEIPIMVKELVQTAGGLSNLMFTYSDDVTMESSLMILVEDIERFVRLNGEDSDVDDLKGICGVLRHLRVQPVDLVADLVD
jgi:hypothetical protein